MAVKDGLVGSVLEVARETCTQCASFPDGPVVVIKSLSVKDMEVTVVRRPLTTPDVVFDGAGNGAGKIEGVDVVAILMVMDIRQDMISPLWINVARTDLVQAVSLLNHPDQVTRSLSRVFNQTERRRKAKTRSGIRIRPASGPRRSTKSWRRSWRKKVVGYKKRFVHVL